MVRAPQTSGRPAWKLVPTGQHFEPNMSTVFFDELRIPKPDVHFNSGGTGMPRGEPNKRTRASGPATVATAHLMASICGC